MPGVFRDPATGTFRYYTVNEYEERRRRDLDDLRRGPHPLPPRPPMTFTFTAPPTLPTPAGTPPAPVATLQTADEINLQALVAAANAHQPQTFLPPAAAWSGAPTPQAATAVSFADLNRFVENLSKLPAHAGEFPAFDAMFDRLAGEGKSIAYEKALDLLIPKL